MGKDTFTITSDDFITIPTVKLLELDPDKFYVVKVDQNAPDKAIQGLAKELSAHGIFAILLPMEVKFYSSFPVEIGLQKTRRADIAPDLKASGPLHTECPPTRGAKAKTGPAPAAKGSGGTDITGILMRRFAKVDEMLEFARQNQIKVEFSRKDGKDRIARRIAGVVKGLTEGQRSKVLQNLE